MLIDEQDYLEHYGREGMKWYQHIFGDYQKGAKYAKEGRGDLVKEHTIKKGTVMFRTTANPDESLEGSKYVTYLKSDRDLYRGTYSGTIKSNSGKKSSDPVYEKTYELTQDLKVPSREMLRSAYSEVMSNEKLKKDAISGYITSLFERDKIDYMLNYDDWEKYLRKDIKDWSDKTIKEFSSYTPDQCFAITARSLASSNPAIKDAVIKSLKSKGYNAMVDEGGVGGVGGTIKEGVEPLIIFDSSSALKETSTNKLSQKTVENAMRDYNKWKREANSNKRVTW